MKKLFVIGMMFFATSVFAGEFSTHCFSTSNEVNKQCANLINDLVTDKWIEKYPSKKYNIVVISDVSRTKIGVNSFAVVMTSMNEDKKTPRISVKRFNSSASYTGQLSNDELVEMETYIIRSAVKNMMDSCDTSNCEMIK